MFELKQENYSQVSNLFANIANCVPVFAVLEGKEPGRVFVDDQSHPTCVFVWTRFGYLYLAGDSDNEKFCRELGQLLNAELIEESKKYGESCLILYPDNASWEVKMELILEGKRYLKLYRKVHEFDKNRFEESYPSVPALPAGFRLEKTDKEFGYALINDNQVVSTCEACFSTQGHSANQKVEIGIDTANEYRQKGFATITAVAFIRECLAKGIIPNWECFWDNTPSVNLAKKLCFEEVYDHPIFYWEEH